MKKIIVVLFALLFVFSVTSCGNSYDGEYVPLDMTTIHKEYKENSARAKETYIGTYVEVTGVLAAINSSSNIAVHMPDDNAIGGKRVIMCKLKNKETKEMLLSMSVGDTITVRGKITKIFGLWDCHLDVYEID